MLQVLSRLFTLCSRCEVWTVDTAVLVYPAVSVRFVLQKWSEQPTMSNSKSARAVKGKWVLGGWLMKELRLDIYYSPSSFSSKTGLLEELFAPILFFHLAQWNIEAQMAFLARCGTKQRVGAATVRARASLPRERKLHRVQGRNEVNRKERKRDRARELKPARVKCRELSLVGLLSLSSSLSQHFSSHTHPHSPSSTAPPL